MVLDDVHRRHRQAGPVDQAADGAVELDVVEVRFARPDFRRVLFGFVPERGQVFMPEARVVVEIDFRIEDDDLALLGDRQWVDLDDARVFLKVELANRHHDLHDGRDLLVGEAEIVGHLLRLERQQSEFGRHLHAEDFLRRVVGDLLDVHPAGGGGHEDRQARGAVEHHAHVEFFVRLRVRLHNQRADLLAFGSRLQRHERVLQHRFGDRLGLVAVADELHAAEFFGVAFQLSGPATAGVNLGFHHRPATVAELVERGRNFVRRFANDVFGNRGAVGRQQFLGLIFVDFHAHCLGKGRSE